MKTLVQRSRYPKTFGTANVIFSAATLSFMWLDGDFRGSGFTVHGWIALTVGTVLVSALGTGLMGLIFYSDASQRDSEVYHSAEERDQATQTRPDKEMHDAWRRVGDVN
jgi:hypothetical protein